MGETVPGTQTKLRLTQGIARACQQTPHRNAIIAEGEAITWVGFADRVARLATLLCREGLHRGDRVAILAESSPRYLAAYYATLWAGGIIAPVNSRFAMAEMAEMLDDCTPRLLLHTIILYSQELLPLVVAMQLVTSLMQAANLILCYQQQYPQQVLEVQLQVH